MKKINWISLLLAVLVIASFLAVAVSIGYRDYLLSVLFMIAGFVIMGFGIARKKKKLIS